MRKIEEESDMEKAFQSTEETDQDSARRLIFFISLTSFMLFRCFRLHTLTNDATSDN